MSDRLEAVLGDGGPGVWQDCESRVALSHRACCCRPEKGVIKEAGRLKLDLQRVTEGEHVLLRRTSANEQTRLRGRFNCFLSSGFQHNYTRISVNLLQWFVSEVVKQMLRTEPNNPDMFRINPTSASVGLLGLCLVHEPCI